MLTQASTATVESLSVSYDTDPALDKGKEFDLEILSFVIEVRVPRIILTTIEIHFLTPVNLWRGDSCARNTSGRNEHNWFTD